MVNFLLVVIEIVDKGGRLLLPYAIPYIKNGSFYRFNNQIQGGKIK